ncbi:24190_t:CDS:2 [Gigaspora rosea]|nr:24190_t:CDS:2 [Gigaspora rosea]
MDMCSVNNVPIVVLVVLGSVRPENSELDKSHTEFQIDEKRLL